MSESRMSGTKMPSVKRLKHARLRTDNADAPEPQPRPDNPDARGNGVRARADVRDGGDRSACAACRIATGSAGPATRPEPGCVSVDGPQWWCGVQLGGSDNG